MATTEIRIGPAETVIAQDEWAAAQNSALRTAWDRYDIALPHDNELIPRLRVAAEITATFAAARPDIDVEEWGALYVPPTTEIAVSAKDWSVRPELRALQLEVELEDLTEAERAQKLEELRDYKGSLLTAPTITGEGELYVTMIGESGVSLSASPQAIMHEGLHSIAGHRALDLGLLEYAALSLQVGPKLIDAETNTLLLANGAGHAPDVPLAHAHHGGVEFRTRRATAVERGDRFRYGVLITSAMAEQPSEDIYA